MGGHLADDMGIVADAGSAGIGGPSVGLGGSADREIVGDEGMQALGRVVGHLGEPDAAGSGTAVLDLDGADDQHFALRAAAAAAGERIVLAAAGDFGFVDLDQAGERAAVGCDHTAAQLGAHQPRRLVRAEAELALQLQGGDAVGMGRHQIGRPEPSRQRQFGVLHDRAGGHRGLPATDGALPGPCLGLQFPRLGLAAAGADKTLRPARCEEVLRASRFIGEATLELDQGAGKLAHGGPREIDVC